MTLLTELSPHFTHNQTLVVTRANLYAMDVSHFLQDIDRELQLAGVPIPFRVVQAASRIPRLIGGPISLTSNVIEYVQEWFYKRYGDRADYQVRLGRIPLLIHGDLVVLEMIPRLERTHATLRSRPSFFWAVDAGPDFWETLHEPDREHVRGLLEMGWVCFSELCPLVSDRMLSALATDDLDIAIEELARSAEPRPALSKWASEQAAEKSLKEFIRRQAKREPPRHHKIHRLHELAVASGLPSLSGFSLPEGPVLDLAECSPGARYGDVHVSIQDAVSAYYAALIVSFTVAARLRILAGKSNWLSPQAGDSPGLFVTRRLCDMTGIRFGGVTSSAIRPQSPEKFPS